MLSFSAYDTIIEFKMPVNYRELINAAEVVAEEEQMKVTMKYTLAGAGFTTFTTLLGSVIAGPVGLGIGKFINLWLN